MTPRLQLILNAAVIVIAIAIITWGCVEIWKALLPVLKDDQLPTEVLLTLFIVIGTLALMAALIIFAVVSRSIDGPGPSHTRGALSLPHGSVSAVLALIIVVIFSVASIHLFGEIRSGEGTGLESRGVTQDALAQLPSDRIISVTAEPLAQGATTPTYIVRLSGAHDDSVDLANSLLVIFSTLLVAIVGFYFGQGATTAGVRAVTGPETLDPTRPRPRRSQDPDSGG